jgi:hypothetical protein
MSSDITLSNNNGTERLTTFCHAEQAPNDIWQLICSHLETPRDVARMGLTNHRLFVRIFLNPSIWDAIVQKYFPDSHANSQSKAKGSALCQHLTNVENNKKTGRYRTHKLADETVANTFNNLISKDQLILAKQNGDIEILDLKSRKTLQTLRGHQHRVNSILVDENQNQLISASDDDTIKIWDLISGNAVQTLQGHQNSVKKILLDRNQLISASDDGTIMIWDLKSGRAVHTLAAHRERITDILIDEDQFILASLGDGKIKIWDPKKGVEIRTIAEGQGLISCILMYENNLISASFDDETIKIWDLKNSQEIARLAGNEGGMATMLVHKNLLISASRDGIIRIWDLKSKEEIGMLKGHSQQARTLFAHDNLLFSCNFVDGLKIWDLKTRTEVQTLPFAFNLNASLLNYKNQLIIRTFSSTTLWDFDLFPLSSYSKQVVEENLPILGKIALAERNKQPELAKELTQKLDPAFRERLKQHAFNIGTPSTYSAEVISRVQTEVCVEALLHAIYDEDRARVLEFLGQLVTIDSQNKEIYALLWEVYGGDRSGIFEWGEFSDSIRELHRIALSQKEEATLAFKEHLKKRWGVDLPLFLADLGFTCKEDYSKKLGCTPDYLQKIGICSSADIKPLGLTLSNFQHLQIVPEGVTKDHNQLQTQAHVKKDAVCILLHTLSNAVDQKLSETKDWIELHYAQNWTLLQGELNSYLSDLIEKCEIRRVLLAEFGPGNYEKIVKEVNALIDKFHALDQEHQIAKLRAYVGQTYILGAWNNLRDNQDIESLAALLERRDIAPQDIFNMGQ